MKQPFEKNRARKYHELVTCVVVQCTDRVYFNTCATEIRKIYFKVYQNSKDVLDCGLDSELGTEDSNFSEINFSRKRLKSSNNRELKKEH